MLEAERQALSREAYVATLALLEKEMTIIVDYCNAMSTQAALIGGFVWACFSGEYAPEPHELNAFTETLYFGFSSAGFAFMMCTVIAAMVTSNLGPIRALKGHEPDAMRRAVERMKLDRHRVFTAFFLGILSNAGAFFTLIWLKLDSLAARTVTTLIAIIICVACFLLMKNAAAAYSVDDASPMAGSGLVKGATYLQTATAASKA